MPDAFKNTNFCIVAGNWNECGAALLFDARLNPEIQTVSSHNDFYDIGFEGPIRPDHGRMIWGEVAMPGYGLYDRALGAAYINGLWEAIDKASTRGI